jgi:hypothetical protein
MFDPSLSSVDQSLTSLTYGNDLSDPTRSIEFQSALAPLRGTTVPLAPLGAINMTEIEKVGNTVFLRDGANKYFAQVGTNAAIALMRNGTQLYQGYAGWNFLAVETVNGSNQALVKNASAGWRIWGFDSNWNWVSAQGIATSQIPAQEAVFKLDIDADGKIASFVESVGNTTFIKAGDNKYFAQQGSNPAIALMRNGTQLYERYAGWDFLAVEAVNGANDLLVKNSSLGVRIWHMDSNWNLVSVQGVATTQVPLQETIFGVDADGNGTIEFLAPTITVVATDANTGEPNDSGQFMLTRTGNSAQDLTVNYTISGTATAGVDHTLSATGQVTFAAGSATALVDFDVVDDNVYEGDETVILTLIANGNYGIGSSNSATVSIQDDDLQVINITANGSQIGESSYSYNGHTYLLTATPKTWEEAQLEAQQYGGNLVTINDAAEEQWLKSTFGTDRYFLIGLTDKASEGNFVWASGEPVNYTNWNLNEPNDLGGEDYGMMNGPGWNDLPSWSQLYGIIESPSTQGQLTLTRVGSTSSALTINYTVSGTATNGKDYTNLGGTATFAAGSSTATINVNPLYDNVLESNETVTVTLTPNNAYQLGTAVTANLAIVDNTDYPTQSYLNFDGVDDYVEVPSNNSLNFGSGDLSISVWVKSNNTTDDIDMIVNKRTDASGLEQGYSLFLYYGKLTFQLATGGGNAQNYISNTLVADGEWHLVTVTVDRDNADGGKWYVDGTLKETFNPTAQQGSLDNDKQLLIGRRSYNNYGITYYLNGSLDDLKLFNYVLSPEQIQQNNLLVNEPGLVGYWKLNGNANDSTSNHNNGILQNNPTWYNERINTVSISANTANTSESYAEYNGHKYLLTSTAKTWEQAQQEAQQYGGNLVTINDATEEQWLQSTFGTSESFWIGLTDKVSEGNFVWINGEPVTYTNWYPNEPNDSLGNEDYTHMNVAGKWNDHNSTAVFRGLIEIPSTPGQFTLTRTGDLANSLTVNYSVSGAATNGTDYNALTGFATFAAGSSSALVNINPIDDPVYELNETVTLTLATNGNYNITNSNSATVTILQTFIIWDLSKR